MHIIYFVAIPIVVLLLILLFMPVGIKIHFSYLNGKFKPVIKAGLGFIQIDLSRFLRRKQTKPETEKEKGKKDLTFSAMMNSFSKATDALRYLKKKFTVKLFSINVRMALGDAADTGIATGAGYAAIYSLLGTLDRYFILKKYDVNITPVFQGFGFEAEFQGEFQLRLLYCFGLFSKMRKEDVV